MKSSDSSPEFWTPAVSSAVYLAPALKVETSLPTEKVEANPRNRADCDETAVADTRCFRQASPSSTSRHRP